MNNKKWIKISLCRVQYIFKETFCPKFTKNLKWHQFIVIQGGIIFHLSFETIFVLCELAIFMLDMFKIE